MVVDSPRETPPDEGPSTAAEPGDAERPDMARGPDEPPVFQHPPWMVGVIMIFAVVAIVAGLGQPIWWLVGSPFILALVILIWVRLTGR